MLKRLVILTLLTAPLGAWAFFKPIRAATPELTGLTCPDPLICIDTASRFDEASRLYREALAFVQAGVGQIRHHPRVIFCATQECYRSFGFGESAANTVAEIGIVVSPRAWKPHYLRHEMIHHLQNERLGSIKTWLALPEWFVEGMAYSLSEDPRRTLAQPWQRYRSEFDVWYRHVGKEQLWTEASRL